jgi:hypothetical protein
MSIEELKVALEAVIAHNWSDELTGFTDNEESRRGHIFRHLVALDNFVNGTERAPESYLTNWLCECGRRPVDCATYEDAEALHGDRV